MTCARLDCTSGKPATEQPVLKIWAEGSNKNYQPALMVVGVFICADCAKISTVKDFISDEGWGVIMREFYDADLTRPDRQAVELVFKHNPKGKR